MSEIGKKVRMDRITDRDTGRIVIVPMDHGISMGPIEGLKDMTGAVNKVAEGGANAVLVHKGIVRAGYRGYGQDIGLIIHLSGSTNLGPDPNKKVSVSSVEEAVSLGADAVSIHVNLGADNEPEQLREAGLISERCAEWGNASNSHDVSLEERKSRTSTTSGTLLTLPGPEPNWAQI